jgi:hypothetical protein
VVCKPRIPGVSISTVRVSPQSSTICPTTFYFEAEISATDAGTVAYRWEFSNGSVSKTEILTFDNKGAQTVKTSWSRSTSDSGWVRLHVLQPSKVTSTEATFTLTCKFVVDDVIVTVTPKSSKNCPMNFAFTAEIYANGAGVVTYVWEFSDDVGTPAVSAKQTVTFNNEGVQRVKTARSFSSPYTGWARLRVLEPNKKVVSNEANFILVCKPPQGLPAPVLRSPATGSVFKNFPRTLTLRWSAVSGAAYYMVEIDCFDCCKKNQWCTDVGKSYKLVRNLKATSYTFNFVGAQPGRWRVWAVDAAGNEGSNSDWWEFKFTK